MVLMAFFVPLHIATSQNKTSDIQISNKEYGHYSSCLLWVLVYLFETVTTHMVLVAFLHYVVKLHTKLVCQCS